MSSGRKKTKIVDGYTAMRAAQKAAEHGVSPTPTGGTAPHGQDGVDAAAPPTGPVPIGSRIGRTVMPSRQEIVCHQCAHAFDLVGKTSQTVCPKCRSRLKMEEVTIEGPWDRDLCTAGSIVIKPGGIIQGGVIVANNIVVEGAIKGGKVRASRCVEVRNGSDLAWEALQWLDLHVSEGVEVSLPPDKCSMRVATLAGTLHAHLECTAGLHILPTGCLVGSISSPSLRVEEGGGLLASVSIGATDTLA